MRGRSQYLVRSIIRGRRRPPHSRLMQRFSRRDVAADAKRRCGSGELPFSWWRCMVSRSAAPTGSWRSIRRRCCASWRRKRPRCASSCVSRSVSVAEARRLSNAGARTTTRCGALRPPRPHAQGVHSRSAGGRLRNPNQLRQPGAPSEPAEAP